MRDMLSIDNPILTALATLPDHELQAADIMLPDAPDIADWLAEVANLVATEQGARRGGQRPLNTNGLVQATTRLSTESYAALLASFYELGQITPDGPRRRFVRSLGFLLAVVARTSGRFDPARQN